MIDDSQWLGIQRMITSLLSPCKPTIKLVSGKIDGLVFNTDYYNFEERAMFDIFSTRIYDSIYGYNIFSAYVEFGSKYIIEQSKSSIIDRKLATLPGDYDALKSILPRYNISSDAICRWYPNAIDGDIFVLKINGTKKIMSLYDHLSYYLSAQISINDNQNLLIVR